MKIIRFFLASTLLTSIVAAQFPTTADCQMATGVVSAICAMPCCKSIPMPKCPHVLATAPRDAITASPISFSTTLQTLFTFTTVRLLQPVLREFAPQRFIDTCRSLVSARAIPARAPPSDYILLSA